MEDLKSFPDEVQQTLGFELYQVELGDMPASAKPLQGEFSGTHELVENFDGDTYRAVFIAKLKDRIYVLHCFQKKSKRGREIPLKDKELIRKRLKQAIEDSRQ